jgi:formate-dependent nitrite reductase membrane component NrfD
MNLFVAEPHWGWWIILYFFLGGIAAGAYFMAALIDLVGHEDDHELARVGYWIAFPLILLCGLFLTVDLEQPERFWHMLLRSEIVDEALRAGWPWTGRSWGLMVQAPLLKYWSPMSIGSWSLLVFGLCSGLSFLGSLWPGGRLDRLLRRGVIGRALQVAGSLVGFFVAAYTGSLLTATNQPVWSDSVWIAPLFLVSAASTGIAAIMILTWARRVVPAGSWHRLEKADRWALGLELVVFVVFLVSLQPLLGMLWSVWQGRVLVAGTLIVGLLVPLGWHLLVGTASRRNALAVSVLVLLGGFLLRFAIITTPPEILSCGPTIAPAGEAARQDGIGWNILGDKMPTLSLEAGRERGGGPGADPGNKRPDFQPKSKVFQSESP